MKELEQAADSSSKSAANETSANTKTPKRVSTFDRLSEACKRKDLATIKLLVGLRPELINRRDKLGRNLLHYSVILIEPPPADDGPLSQKRPKGQRSTSGEEQTISLQCLECFNFLTDRCDLRLWWQQDSDGLSLLHLAVISSNVPLVKHIVYEHPYSTKYPLVCTLDNEHHSPLHWAVITNNLQCVKLLISYAGVKLAHEPDLNGATPLHYATQTSNYPKYRQQLRRMLDNAASAGDSLNSFATLDSKATDDQRARQEDSQSFDSKSILTQCDCSLASGKGRPDHCYACKLKTLEYLVRLPQINLECMDKDKRTPLLWAASSGCREAIMLLITNGANANSYDINRLGALHCAASHGFTDCLECLLNMAPAPAPTSGEQVNQVDNLNCTPLFYAVLSGNIECVEILLDRGAKLNWQDAKGRTASHFAALKGQLHSLKLLQERGANLWLPNKQGDLPLHYAIKSGRQQVVQWLLAHSPYECAVNAINNFGRSPIHLAVQKGHAKMAEYLISCGANLNQLVKVKEKGSSTWRQDSVEQLKLVNGGQSHQAKNGVVYHYETAMDMASRLGHHECVKLLVANGALPAAKVISERASQQTDKGNQNVRSVFDLHLVDGTSPIGFETSSSSASMAPTMVAGEQFRTVAKSSQRVPKLPSRPVPETIPASDSAGSASPPTNSRGARVSATSSKRQTLRRERVSHQESAPYKGGISYNNELIDASIKCRVYNKSASHNQSFPQESRRYRSGANHNSAASVHGLRTSRSAGGHEIITNVNVYATPCAKCCRQSRKCASCSYNKQLQSVHNQTQALSDSGDVTSEHTTGDSESEEQSAATRLPFLGPNDQAAYQQSVLRHHLPPSQGYEQHLPVILSELEASTTSATSNEPSADSASPQPASLNYSHRQAATRLQRRAEQEPRFDRSSRSMARTSDRYRDHVSSPVAEYIHGGYQLQPRGYDSSTRASSLNVRGQQQHRDYSQVRPRVDTHWTNETANNFIGIPEMQKSKSTSSMMEQQELRQNRSLSRQTIPKTGRLSVDDLELTTNVEKAIRKYRQETRLFEELQSLKRSQIRSGRANEALLVKRLVEHFSNEVAPLDLLELYHGPYTYKSYERFLYDQLRKLSQSNRAKLAEIDLSEEREEMPIESGQQQQQHGGGRNYSDEDDMKAEQELRRVLGGESSEPNYDSDNDDSNTDSASSSPEPSKGLEEIRVKGESGDEKLDHPVERERIQHDIEPEPSRIGEKDKVDVADEQVIAENAPAGSEGDDESLAARRQATISSKSSSRRSSIDIEREKLAELPLRVKGDDQPDSEQFEQQADLMSSSIMTDALGNVSRSCSRVGSPKLRPSSPLSLSDEPTLVDETLAAEAVEQKETTTDDTTSAQTAMGHRRRSVVNIGNKMEIIYHDVGIEIDKVADDKNDDDDDPRSRNEEQPVEESSSREPAETDEPQEPAAKTIERSASKPKFELLENVQEHAEPEDEEEKMQQTNETIEPEPEVTERKYESETPIEPETGQKGEEEAESSEKNLSSNLSTTAKAIRATETVEDLNQRRTSSPPVYRRDEIEQTVPVDLFRSTVARRRASIGLQDTNDGVNLPPRQLSYASDKRKVFNGHDLDEMRGRSLGRQTTIEQEQVTQSTRNTTEETAVVSEISQAEEEQKKAEVPSSRGSSIDDRATDEGFVSRSTVHRSISQRETPIGVATIKRPKLKRSRIPSKEFVVVPPIEQVKQRWSEIKARERRKLAAGLKDGQPSAFTFMDGGQDGASSRLEVGRGEGRQSQLAKSQPNLDRESSKVAETQLSESSQYPNFTLLYEINKGSMGRHYQSSSGHTLCSGFGKLPGQAGWCHRRVIRIVDVRTLKRTSSLPESLIYSNNLLKRFSILKL